MEGLRKEEVLGKAEEIEGRERRLIRKKWRQEGRREREGEVTSEGRQKMQGSEARKRLISRRGRKGPERRKGK